MLTEFSGDSTDPDQLITDAGAARDGLIRIRVQPTVLGKDGQYRGWRQNRWALECDSPAEVFAVRDAMRAFFEALGRLGPKAVVAVLRAATTKEPAA